MEIDLNDTPEEAAAAAAKAKAEAEEKAASDRAVGSIPGLFIDTWRALTFTGHIRLTFGEMYGDVDHYRSAIILSLDDAELLGRQILRMVERRKARDKERAAKKQEDDSSEL